MANEFLSVNAFADRLGVKADTVRMWVRDERIGSIRLGPGEKAHIRIPMCELERIVNGELRRPKSPAAQWSSPDDPTTITLDEHWRTIASANAVVAERDARIRELESQLAARA